MVFANSGQPLKNVNTVFVWAVRRTEGKMMKKGLLYGILLLFTLGFTLTASAGPVTSSTPASQQDLDRILTFEVQNGPFRYTHKLYLSIPTTLYEYYNSRSRFVSADSDYAKYATPTVFTSIAENIQKITNDTAYGQEQFANAVLTLVRQIPYNKSNIKYPIEAIVENSGDCDVLSLLAASIMQAGGLDVVLFYYKDLNPSHMNIGVYLPYKPVYRSWWTVPVGFEYKNKTYWMAEATSLAAWKVGERPDLLAGSKPYIIPLNGSQKSSPGRIVSNLDSPLPDSGISITISPDNSNFSETRRQLVISGVISPAMPDKEITMYITQSKSIQTVKTTTDDFGNYSFDLNITTTLKYNIQTSCTDIEGFAGSESDLLTVFGSYRPATTDYELAYSDGYASSADSLATFIFGNLVTRNSQEFLKGNTSGIGVQLSGEFIVLNNNQTAQQLEPIVVYRIQHVGSSRNRHPIDIVVKEEITPPVLPNGQFGFLLTQNGDNNYSASVKILEGQDAAQITTQLDEEDSSYMNASQITEQNTWYKIRAILSETATNATLYQENGTPLNNVTPKTNTTTTNQIGVVLAYNPGAVIAFKNLKVETLASDEARSPVSQPSETPVPSFGCLVEWGALVTVVLVVAACLVLVRRRRKKNHLKACS